MLHIEDITHNNLEIIIDYDETTDRYYGSVRNMNGVYIYCAENNEYILALTACFSFIDSDHRGMFYEN